MAVYSTAVSPFIFTEEQTETINTGVDTPGKPYIVQYIYISNKRILKEKARLEYRNEQYIKGYNKIHLEKLTLNVGKLNQ